MAKNKTEIHVTTVFDGELDATDVFVSLILSIIKTRFSMTVFRLDCAGKRL